MQTLSRLNRIHPLKENTFVLDFRNETEDIVKAFEQYYGARSPRPPTPTSCATPGADSMTSTCSGPRRSRRPSPSCSTIGDSKRPRPRSTRSSTRPCERFERLGEEDRLGFRER